MRGKVCVSVAWAFNGVVGFSVAATKRTNGLPFVGGGFFLFA